MVATMEIAKVSDIDVATLQDYLRVADPSDADKGFLAAILKASTSYMCKYTGLTQAQLDESTDFVIAALALAQDMYDNRTLYADSTNPNMTVQSILDMHSINLLPSVVVNDD